MTCEDVSHKWDAQCFEYNKGLLVGGPFDGKKKSFLFFPGDYEPGHKPSHQNTNVCRMFSSKFPEGAVYHWNEEKGEWHYIGQMDEEGQDGAKELFGVFDVEPNSPL